MKDFNQPPIPSPFETIASSEVKSPVSSEWKDAPPIVRGWAYPLTWLGILVLPIVMLFAMLGGPSNEIRGLGERIGMGLLYFVFWAIAVWQNRNLKDGAPVAWPAQIVLSIIGLCGFPLGTLINIYILTQWFKPETKAWFDRN